MKLSIRIPLTLTIIVVVTGIIAFIKIGVQSKPFPTASFVIWISVSVILVAITACPWSRSRKR